ncbi:MAG: hypothetical protein HLUCCA11_23915 [Phormidesmis priestleyi Ana]|uniref:Uncharacterized protein n=1 Tax=Phormidesmis priestleyi Ana TaxID=1666911 RepID=A0A0P7ZP85_9CYAN|nr:MAG: hypothetical protein HLUCCA11_23915 [Phormidesmis priestleyi Ana]
METIIQGLLRQAVGHLALVCVRGRQCVHATAHLSGSGRGLTFSDSRAQGEGGG